MNLDLADARLLIFDRVLDGDDLGGFVLDFIQSGVERGAFAGASRTGYENDAVRPIDELLEYFVGVIEHADVGQVEHHARLVQETHDDAFAVNHRNDRNANVDFVVFHAHLDAAVLRQAFLGNVKPGHDLDAADDGGLKSIDFRRQGLRLQNAVDAVADAKRVLFGLDVNVAGSLIGGFDQDFVDQLHHRRFLGHLGQFTVVGLKLFEELDVFLAVLDHGRDGFAADA